MLLQWYFSFNSLNMHAVECMGCGVSNVLHFMTYHVICAQNIPSLYMHMSSIYFYMVCIVMNIHSIN